MVQDPERRGRLLRSRALHLAAATLLFGAPTARAACDPETCDAAFECGSRECVGLTCETFLDDAGTECRPAAGICDREETCNGSSLDCPSDAKRSAAFECRAAAPGFCDAAEHCDGSSDDCPEDVGIPPTLSRITALDVGLSASERRFEVEFLGEDLCMVGVFGILGGSSFSVFTGFPHSRIVADFDYLQTDGPIESWTMHLVVNQGAAEGTLEFVAGEPDGSIEILSPGDGATVGQHPTFSIDNSCASCGTARVQIFDHFGDVVAETPLFAGPYPIDQPFALALDDFVGDPLPGGLPEGTYFLETDAIDVIGASSILQNASLAGDTSGNHFFYKFGTSVRNEISFSVPEPAPLPAALGAVAGLAACAATRGARRRRR